MDCCHRPPASLREAVFQFAREQYDTEPEFLWRDTPDAGVLRHDDNRKWFAVLMRVKRSRLGLDLADDSPVDVLNVKCPSELIGSLRMQEGILPAYHMNKRHWVSVLLDGTVPLEEVCGLLDISFDQTARKKLSGRRSSKPKRIITEWLVPANPKYYDVEQAFREQDEIIWKQGRGIEVGNTVFLYVGAPVSSILFRCKVTATNIPYDYSDDCVKIRQVMHIKRLQTYPHGKFSLTRMRSLGVSTVRGPRSLSYGLRHALLQVEQDN